MTGIYHHPPGKLSRWGVVDVGLKCTHKCNFCYYAGAIDDDPDPFHGMRVAKFLPTEHILGLARSLKANGFLGFDVTGGEPALHPGIVELAREAKRLGLAMRVITLGQFLMREMKAAPGTTLLNALIDAGVTDFLLSVHAVNYESFKEITGGDWGKMHAAMQQLANIRFDFCTNTTVHEGNFRQLPEIAEHLAYYPIYAANLIVMNAYYAWSRPGGAAKAVQGHYGEIRPYLLEARDKLEAAGIAVNIRYAPLCTVRGAERNLVGIVGVRHDPHEWMNAIDHMEPGPAEQMGRRLNLRSHDAGATLVPVYDEPGIVARRGGKVFPERCKGCAAAPVCDGIDARYLAERGDSELEPYNEFRGDLLDRERLAYAPAYVVKTEPFADARGAVRAAFGITNR